MTGFFLLKLATQRDHHTCFPTIDNRKSNTCYKIIIGDKIKTEPCAKKPFIGAFGWVNRRVVHISDIRKCRRVNRNGNLIDLLIWDKRKIKNAGYQLKFGRIAP